MALLLQDILASAADAIAGDEQIIAKCLDLYGRAATVHVGAAGYQAAESSDYPAFTLLGLTKERTETEPRRVYEITVGLALHDENYATETTVDGVSIKTYRGAATLEDLLDLAMAAIKNISEDLFFDIEIYDFEPVEFYPLFVGEISLTVGFEVFLGGEEPTLVT